MQRIAYFAMLSLVVLPLNTLVAQQVTLRWKLAEGDQLNWVATQSIKTKRVSPNARTVNATLAMTLQSTWLVDLVEGDQITLRHRIDAVKLIMNAPPGDPIVFDSAKPAANPESPAATELAARMKPLVGLVLEVLMTSAGEVLSVTPQPTSGSNAAPSSDSGPLDGADAEALKQIVRGGIPLLPARPVRRGSVWRDEQTMEAALGELVVRRSFTLKAPNDALQRIELNGTLALRPLPAKAGDPQTSLRSQKLEGSFLFDTKAGNLVSSDVSQSMATRTMAKGTWDAVTTESKLAVKVERVKLP